MRISTANNIKWVSCKLEDIAQIFSGSSAPQNKEAFSDDGVPFIRVSDLKGRQLNNLIDSRDKISQNIIKEKNLKLAPKGSILFPKSGASLLANGRALLGIDAYFANHLVAIKTHNDVNNLFLFYQLCIIDMANYVSNIAYPSLNLETIKKIRVTIPYLNKKPNYTFQKNIAKRIESILSCTNESANLAKSARVNTDNILNWELKNIFLENEYGWESISLSSILDIKGGKQPPKSEFIDKPKKNYIRLLQIRDFGKQEKPVYVKKNNNLTLVNKDDVLIARYGASVGKILTGKKGAINVALVKTIPKKNLKKRFLYYLLSSPDFQRKIHALPGRMAQAGFNRNDLTNIKVFVPTIHGTLDSDTQNEIIEKLDKINNISNELNKKNEKILELFHYLRESVLTETFQHN